MLLLDTNIVSYLYKKDSRAVFYIPRLRNHEIAISFVTLGELYKWPMERGWGERKTTELHQWISTFVILPYDDLLVRTWAQLVFENNQKGKPREFSDSWIAATALRHELTLMTHNRRHFEGIQDLQIISDN